MVIYLTTNLINGKKYVGKDARNQKWYLGSGKYLKKAIKKYGKENFKKEILEECSNIEELNQAEIKWLRKLKCKDDCIYYNATDTLTPSSFGKKLTEEHKRKISQSNKGRKLTNEQRQHLSKLRKGVSKGPHSEKTKEKIRKSNTGQKRNKETREKMSKAQKGKPRVYLRKPVVQYDIETNKVLNVYEKIIDVEKNGFNRWAVQNVLKGRNKTSGGFGWRYT